jgi:hypothetical protein
MISFYKIVIFFKKVKALAKNYRENNASEYIKKMAERIKKAAAKLYNGI